MKSIITDTNGFLRFFLNDIPQQKVAFENLLKQAKKSRVKVIVPQIVVFELNFILGKYYNFSKKAIVDKLKTITGSPYLSVWDRDAFSDAFNLYEKQNISLVDCFLIALSKREDADIFTFDKNLKKLVILTNKI